MILSFDHKNDLTFLTPKTRPTGLSYTPTFCTILSGDIDRGKSVMMYYSTEGSDEPELQCPLDLLSGSGCCEGGYCFLQGSHPRK